MINWFIGFLVIDFFFFSLKLSHPFFSDFIQRCHDKRHTEICYNNSSEIKKPIFRSFNTLFIELNRFLILLFDEKNMSKVHLPNFMISTELSTLSEKFFNSIIIFLVPINLCLSHQSWNILFKSFIELFQAVFDRFAIIIDSSILDLFGKFS